MMESLEEDHLRVRRMAAEDLMRVHAIDQKSFSVPWALKHFRYEVEENPASYQWVVEIKSGDGSTAIIAGAIVVWLLVDEIHIATIAVDPAYRRRKVATHLLCTALRAGISLGAVSATLEVRAGNMAAQHLYQKFGFQLAGRRKKYYQDNGEDALILTLTNLEEAHLEASGC
ncbi:MAG: ribosomal protein S18-alanine N-acetyltransferase [Anaerolineales bacterium]|jgi:ribosomal-protein-alanine N-acetyltransferase